MESVFKPFDRSRPALTHNPCVERTSEYPADLRTVVSFAAGAEARKVISTWPGYAPTPLIDLPALARQLGIGRLSYKNEAERFGLGSFKALGGAYGVYRAARRARLRQGLMGGKTSSDELSSAPAAGCMDRLTVTTATDGNHGRSVAWGAQLFGCRAVVFVHERVSAWRVQQIESYGATVVRVPGTYDNAVRAAREASVSKGWLLIADTSGSENLPAASDVMAGYMVLIHEALQQLGSSHPPTHVFVQAGVGALAAALLAHLWELFGAKRPRLVVVEAERADCLLRSARAGHSVAVDGELDTIMAGLACGEPSHPAWRILSRGADEFCAVPDSIVAPAMRLLVHSPWGDPRIIAGESAVAGLGLLICACRSARLRDALALTPDTRVLVIGTEGATDPELYRSLVCDPAFEAARA